MDFPPFVIVYHKRTKSPIHAEPKQYTEPGNRELYLAVYYMSEAGYLTRRGHYRELLKLARKGMCVVDREYRSNLVGFAAYACAELDDAGAARRYVKRARKSHNGLHFWTEQTEIILARRSGEPELAADLARDSEYGAHDNPLFSYRHVARVALIESE